MKQTDNIQKAIKMIDSHDWYWMMSDYGYESNYNAAKAGMKMFVKFVSTIDNAKVREMLRNLWTLRWEAAREAINGRKNEENQAKQEELLNALALAA